MYYNFVAKCGHPIQAVINDSQTLQIMGYADPSLEGTTVNFSCPTGQILIGPRTATCTGTVILNVKVNHDMCKERHWEKCFSSS